MSDYKSQVVSVRLEADLVEAVRARAQAEGRSLSGQIVFLVRERVSAALEPPRKPRPITGWLTTRPSLETLADFRAARSALGTQVKRAIRKKAKRR